MIQMKLVSSIREGKFEVLARSRFLVILLEKIIDNLRIKRKFLIIEC